MIRRPEEGLVRALVSRSRAAASRVAAVAAALCAIIFFAAHVSAGPGDLYRRGHIDLELECVFGGEDAEESHVLYQVAGFDVDRNGAVFVTDYKLNCIKKFDPSGSLKLTIGREGEGPGDLRRPTALIIEASGHIVVFDSGNRRIQRLDTDGKHVTTAAFRDLVQEFRLGPSGELYAKVMEIPYGPPTAPSTLKLVRFSSDFKQLTEFDQMKVKLNVVAGSPGSYTVTNAPYPPSLEWDVLPDGRFVVGHSDTDHLRILSSTGEILHDFRVRADRPPITGSDKARFFDRWVRDGKDTLDPALRKVMEFPSHWPYYADLVTDMEGNILLRWPIPVDDEIAYDVYDQTGSFISRVTVGDLPEKVKLGNGVIYALDQSPENLPTVKRYRMK
jgi:hypothetical protein